MSSINKHIASMFEDIHKALMLHDIRVHGFGPKIEALNSVVTDASSKETGIKALSPGAQTEIKEAEAAEKSSKPSGAAKMESSPAPSAA
jgi:hypothetical protein